MRQKIFGWISKNTIVHKHELPKFLYSALLVFCIAYMHQVLRNAKDVLIISHLGTESISAIKVWVVLPVSLLFTIGYIKLTDLVTRTKLYHAMVWFFVGFFVVFTFILYPHRVALTINVAAIPWLKWAAFKYFALLVQHWYYCLFFVCSELLITTLLSISFWQLMNHISSLEESKRFYPLFGVAAQLGLMLAGALSRSFAVSSADWYTTLSKIVVSVVVAGLVISGCIAGLTQAVGKELLNSHHSIKPTKSKPKIGLKDSLKYIASSKPILLITSLLLCYNISLNLIEGIWKKATELFYASNANQIQYFMGNVSFCGSVVSLICAGLSVYVLRHWKWKTAALVSPITIMATGGAFFLLMFFKDSAFFLASGFQALSAAVYFGASYNIASKALKSTFFDATKEMAYIPLSDTLRTKGKAAAEMIGIRLGKGSGAFVQQLLLMLFTNLTLLDFAPIFAVLFLALMGLWLYSVRTLDRTLRRGPAGSNA